MTLEGIHANCKFNSHPIGGSHPVGGWKSTCKTGKIAGYLFGEVFDRQPVLFVENHSGTRPGIKLLFFPNSLDREQYHVERREVMPLKSTPPFQPRLSIAAVVLGLVPLLGCFTLSAAFATPHYREKDRTNTGFGMATGLAVGSLTVAATVNANQMSFATGSGAMALTGGTIAPGGNSPAITANNTGQITGSALTLKTKTSGVCGVTGTFRLSLNRVIGSSGNVTFSFQSAQRAIDGVTPLIIEPANSPGTWLGTYLVPTTAMVNNPEMTVEENVAPPDLDILSRNIQKFV